MNKKINWNEIFKYEDGNLYWKRGGHGRQIFKPAGNKMINGYMKVKYMGKNHLQHRIIYEMHNGPIPKGYTVDHVDNDPANNMLENLRLATYSQNQMNQKSAMKNNKSTGFKNISIIRGKYFYVRIGYDRGKIYCKLFRTLEAAIEHRNLMLPKFHGDFANTGDCGASATL